MKTTIDPVTLEVIHHRLVSVGEEMLSALIRSSFSIVVKEGRDCTTAVFTTQGHFIAQPIGALPMHLGTLMYSVPEILKVFPTSEMQEGDVFLANDPYAGGTHLPDITLVTPIIYQGEVIGLNCSMVHHHDIGAITPGVPTSATSIYQEGLTLPPLKFYDAGKPVKAVHDIIRKNVRVPDAVMGDLGGQIAAGNVGKVRFLELVEDYGKDVILTAMEELMDHAEALTRYELERIPDGSYSFVDYMDNDGVELDKRIKIQATVTIRGSDFIVDFSGTDPQVKGPFNSSLSSTMSIVAFVLRAFTGADIASNSGCFRPVKVNLPEGSLVNPQSPAALGARAVTCKTIAGTLLGALVKAAPERALAASAGLNLAVWYGGEDPLTGQGYVFNDGLLGGSGACPTKDGVDAIASDMSGIQKNPVEALEANFPFRMLSLSLYEGSGGAGKFRGGLGAIKVIELLRGDAETSIRGERLYTRPWGLFGGLPALGAKITIIRKTGETEPVPSKRDVTLHEGDQIHMFVPGGAGYGDPLERQPEAVLEDFLNRRVSLESATDDYGVVVDQKSMSIDHAKTSKLRDKKRKLRGPVTWTYDRGPDGRED